MRDIQFGSDILYGDMRHSLSSTSRHANFSLVLARATHRLRCRSRFRLRCRSRVQKINKTHARRQVQSLYLVNIYFDTNVPRTETPHRVPGIPLPARVSRHA